MPNTAPNTVPVTGQKKGITVRPATAPAGVKPADRGQMPIFRQSEKTTAEYGLSSEEFEKREASAQAISGAMAKKAAPEAKPAAKASGDKKAAAEKKTETKKTAGKRWKWKKHIQIL